MAVCGDEDADRVSRWLFVSLGSWGSEIESWEYSRPSADMLAGDAYTRLSRHSEVVVLNPGVLGS
jgi:hypothetical protein